MDSDIVVPLRSLRQRRSVLAQKLNHVIPATGLFLAGMQAIREGHGGFGFFLGVFELVSSAALVVLFLKEVRAAFRPGPRTVHPAHPTNPTIDWVDIAAGFVLVAEVFEHWHLTHHWKGPTIVTALTTFALGLFHGRLTAKKARNRVLRVNDAGVFIAGRFFKVRTLEAAWPDLQSIDIGPRWAVVTTRAGRKRKLDLDDLEHAPQLRAALLDAQQRLTDRTRPAEQEAHAGG